MSQRKSVQPRGDEPGVAAPADSPVTDREPNRLIREKSPYLLQHAYNPVDWYPWGDEAFEAARKEDKPIFLSIGYSTCHWCHVMEHESFEDTAVARLMNEAFVAIKVDREERPDIDNIYMGVCQIMTGSGGWPLTIIMTPDKKPFFAGTYFPKEGRFGRMGMLDLIPRIADVWQHRRGEVLASAEKITSSLHEAVPAADDAPDSTVLQAAFQQLEARFDSRYGGFGSAPKFPTPHTLMFLLRYWRRSGDSSALAMVEQTLSAMRRGGMFDQIGFGFHRYSTDPQWLLPHFEKMLYDQAMLAMAYTEAYQATGEDGYKMAAREIFTYVLRDMVSGEGGFYSAEDADSEGEEGKSYLWSVAELRSILSPADAGLFIRVYGIEPDGNFSDQTTQQKTGTNIPHLTQPLAVIAGELAIPEPSLREHLETIRRQLYAVREERVHPHKDDKILTDWNGLMIAALSKAAAAFDDSEYAHAASLAADFVLSKLRTSGGRLWHRYRDGQAAVPGHVDDYAFLIWGLLDLYEATFDVSRLEAALALNDQLIEHFWDARSGGFFFTAADAEKLIARQKETYDGAVPSGNAVAMLNLLRLGRITTNPDLEAKASQISRAFGADLRRLPSAHTQMLMAVDFALGPAYEIVIAGDPAADDTRQMLRTLRSEFLPNSVVILRPTNTPTPAITRLSEFIGALTAVQGRATAYVCREYACQRPTNDPVEMMRLVNEEQPTIREARR